MKRQCRRACDYYYYDYDYDYDYDYYDDDDAAGAALMSTTNIALPLPWPKSMSSTKTASNKCEQASLRRCRRNHRRALTTLAVAALLSSSSAVSVSSLTSGATSLSSSSSSSARNLSHSSLDVDKDNQTEATMGEGWRGIDDGEAMGVGVGASVEFSKRRARRLRGGKFEEGYAATSDIGTEHAKVAADFDAEERLGNGDDARRRRRRRRQGQQEEQHERRRRQKPRQWKIEQHGYRQNQKEQEHRRRLTATSPTSSSSSSASIRPGVAYYSRYTDKDRDDGDSSSSSSNSSNGDHPRRRSRLGVIDISGLMGLIGDVGHDDRDDLSGTMAKTAADAAMDDISEIHVQLFEDGPSMTFRRIYRYDVSDEDKGAPSSSSEGGSAVASASASAANNTSSWGKTRVIHAEDITGGDGGYTMSIVSVPCQHVSHLSPSDLGPSGRSAIRTRLVAGSVVTNDTIYDISSYGMLEGGMALVEAIPVEDLPDEAEPIAPPPDRAVRYSGNADTVTATDHLNDTMAAAAEKEEEEMTADPSSRALGIRVVDKFVLDVVVIYTSNAMCAQRGVQHPCRNDAENRGPIEARIVLAVEETNAAFELSGVRTKLRLVYMQMAGQIDDSDTDRWSMKTLLESARSSTQGFEYVSSLRNMFGADFVSIITEQSKYCGMAPIGPSIDAAFSIVSRVCMTGYYSFGHEMAHNFGCDHNQEAASPYTRPFSRGYRNEKDGIRSILAYQCETKGCTRVLRFSNSEGYTFKGMPIGDETHDNARQINLHYMSMSRYRPTKISQPKIMYFTDTATTNGPTSKFTASPSVSPTIKPTAAPSIFPTTSSDEPSVRSTESHTYSPAPARSPNPSPNLTLSKRPTATHSAAPSTSLAPSSSLRPVVSSYHGPYDLIQPAIGDWGSYGNQFDVRAEKNVRIVGLSIHTSKLSDVHVEIWTRPGSHVNAMGNRDGGWTKVQDVTAIGLGRYSLTPLPDFPEPVDVVANTIRAFAVVLKGGGIAYSFGASKDDASAENDDLAIFVGSFISEYSGADIVPWWQSDGPRVWEGVIRYQAEGNSAQVNREEEEGAELNATFDAQINRRKKRKVDLSLLAGASNNKHEAEHDDDGGGGGSSAMEEWQLFKEPGECIDDPNFRHMVTGTVVDCQWVQQNPVSGCGLVENERSALESCGCACSEHER